MAVQSGTMSQVQVLTLMSKVVAKLSGPEAFGLPVTIGTITAVLKEFEVAMKATGMLEES